MRITEKHKTISGEASKLKRPLAEKKFEINQKLRSIVKKHQRGFLTDRQKDELTAQYLKEYQSLENE